MKFRVNDIVITEKGNLAIVEGLDSEGIDVSVEFISMKHGSKNDYNAWHHPEDLKLVGRVKGLGQLIKYVKIAYESKKIK
jgi:hypothetical protein